MKKWKNPELMVLGVEKTEVESFGQGVGGGNGHTPEDCFCKEATGNGHNHGAPGWEDSCECCKRFIPDISLPEPGKPAPS